MPTPTCRHKPDKSLIGVILPPFSTGESDVCTQANLGSLNSELDARAETGDVEGCLSAAQDRSGVYMSITHKKNNDVVRCITASNLSLESHGHFWPDGTCKRTPMPSWKLK